MDKIVKYSLPIATTAFSLYVSLLFALGLFLGYLLTCWFFRHFVEKGRVRDSVYFSFGNWRVHFHHWLMGASFFALLGIFSTIAFWPKVLLGFVGGVIFHDFHQCGYDWYRVIERKKSSQPVASR